MNIKVKTVNDEYGYYRYSQCLCDIVELQMECSGYEPTSPYGDKIVKVVILMFVICFRFILVEDKFHV